MIGVDVVIVKGFIDESKLFVIGGLGGGVLIVWIVGYIDCFVVVVVVKFVINWISFVLIVDFYFFFVDYWFFGKLWDNIEYYMKCLFISYVGNVKILIMLLIGELDYCMLIFEIEQFY